MVTVANDHFPDGWRAMHQPDLERVPEDALGPTTIEVIIKAFNSVRSC
ncbi:hypothetical protein [Nonomuraea typhae]|nr:hypothetical protein [Nonomuraea typhae]